MIRILLSFFIAITLFDNAYGGIGGSADKRAVIGWIGDQPSYSRSLPSTSNIWNTSPYNSIVKISLGGIGKGTGEFISPRHVLTNAHVSGKCGLDGMSACDIHTSDGKIIPTKAILWGMDTFGNRLEQWNANEDKDWAILEITDNYCRKEYRQISGALPRMHGLWRAGFGGLRVLDQNDITMIRKAYDAFLKSGAVDDGHGMYIRNRGLDFSTKYKVFLDKFTELTGKNFIDDYLWDTSTLKVIRGCKFFDSTNQIPGVILHNCDSWGGDSGSSIKTMSGNNVVGVETGSWAYITTKEEDVATNTGILSSVLLGANISSLIKKAEQDCKDWKPDEPEPIEPQPIKPEPGKKNCDLTCTNNTIVVAGTSGCYNFVENENKCLAATGKHLRSDGMANDGTFTYTCVGYNESSDCGGKFKPRPEPIKPEPIKPEPIKPEPIKPEPIKPEPIKPEPVERGVGDQCLASDLPAHATAGHYITNGTNRLMCGNKKCSCAATACEDGWYLAANAKGWSMGWCRSGICPRGKHPNIVGGNKMTGCVDD